MKGMGRKMKWIARKWKQISASKRIVCLIFIGAAVILGITAGLRVWDKSRQKPRVLTALKKLAQEAYSQEHSFAPLLQILEEGEIEQEGYVNLTFSLKNGWGPDSIWLGQMDLAGSFIQYQLKTQQKEKIFLADTKYQIAGIGALDIESYLTEETLIMRIPQMHSSYLRMNGTDLKNRYEHSLLYDVLGEKLTMPETGILVSSTPVFPKKKDLEKIEVIRAFLEEYHGRLGELWQQILVKKEGEIQQVSIGGCYEDCNIFHLTLPMELVQWYLNTCLSDTQKEQIALFDWESETWDVLLYMDDENHIHRMETLLEPKIKGNPYWVKIVCFLKGEERLLDKIQLELQIKNQTEEKNFRIDLENQWQQGERRVYLIVNQIEPKNIERIHANLVMDTSTGESCIEYKVCLPLLVSDGEHVIRRLDQSIKEPDGEMVDLFELDLMGFLKFSKDFNFTLFR